MALGPDPAPVPIEPLLDDESEDQVVAGVARGGEASSATNHAWIVEHAQWLASSNALCAALPTVVNINQRNLEQGGHSSIADWLAADANRIYIGREVTDGMSSGAPASKWKNVFSIKDHGRKHCLRKYKDYILRGTDQQGRAHGLLEDIEELRGKTLGCWCEPSDCHGHVLKNKSS